MSWHCSLALAEEFSVLNCLDTGSYVRLSGSRILEKSSYGDRRKRSSNRSPSGTMLEPLTVSRGVEKWILSLPDSLASPSALLAEEQEMMMSGTCGRIQFVSFVKLDPPLACSKTSPDSSPRKWVMKQKDLFTTTLEPYCETWRKAGMMLNGVCYLRPSAELPIGGRGSGLWRSPDIGAGGTSGLLKEGKDNRPDGQPIQVRLVDQVVNPRLWPTPTRGDPKGSGKSGVHRDRLDYAAERGKTKSKTYATPKGSKSGPDYARMNREGSGGDDLATQIAREEASLGHLDPSWVCWLMGWPIDWCALEPLDPEDFDLWKQMQMAGTWWDVDPADEGIIPRVATNIPNRANRLKALGNGQVPVVVATVSGLLRGE